MQEMQQMAIDAAKNPMPRENILEREIKRGPRFTPPKPQRRKVKHGRQV